MTETTDNPDTTDTPARIRAVIRERFGWTSLRAGQQEAVADLVAGRDVLAVMPTGYGKSAIYQVAALLIDGPTVVVSPLIALQRDQVASLRVGGTDDAVAVNSALSAAEREDAWERVVAGSAEFVFLAPEQLARPDVVDRLAQVSPSLVVVDEAHCVSSWGHDFRPDYLRLGSVLTRLGRPATVALTATAAPPVRSEIIDRLGLRDPTVIATGFDRPNIRLEVVRVADDHDKREQVVARAATLPKPGLVYVATRKDAEAYARELADLGLAARAYHAGLRAAERDAVHEAFTSGQADLVVATSAFGMGIDKPDVRFVLHASVTDSLDSYYQEVGRAGRDGEQALATLLYRPEDLGLQRFHTGGGVNTEVLASVAGAVHEGDGATPGAQLRAELDVSSSRLTWAVNLLEQAGAVAVGSDGAPAWTDDALSVGAAVAEAEEVALANRRMERSRLEMLRGYAETSSCRRQFLLGYFGQELERPCGDCDTCADGSAQAQARAQRAVAAEMEASGAPAWGVNTQVVHAEWGPGVVMREEGDRFTVLFDQVGYKTLARAAVAERGLLERA